MDSALVGVASWLHVLMTLVFAMVSVFSLIFFVFLLLLTVYTYVYMYIILLTDNICLWEHWKIPPCLYSDPHRITSKRTGILTCSWLGQSLCFRRQYSLAGQCRTQEQSQSSRQMRKVDKSVGRNLYCLLHCSKHFIIGRKQIQWCSKIESGKLLVLSSQAECEARAEGKGMRGIGSILGYGRGRKEEPPLASWS